MECVPRMNETYADRFKCCTSCLLATRHTPCESIFAKSFWTCQSQLCSIGEHVTSMKLIVRSYFVFVVYLDSSYSKIIFHEKVTNRIFITFSNYIILGGPFRINTRFYLLFSLCFYRCLRIVYLRTFINRNCY